MLSKPEPEIKGSGQKSEFNPGSIGSKNVLPPKEIPKAKPFTESEVVSDSGDKSSKSGDIWGDEDVALSYDHRDDLVKKHDFPFAK